VGDLAGGDLVRGEQQRRYREAGSVGARALRPAPLAAVDAGHVPGREAAALEAAAADVGAPHLEQPVHAPVDDQEVAVAVARAGVAALALEHAAGRNRYRD